MKISEKVFFRSVLGILLIATSISWAAPMTVTIRPKTQIDQLIESPYFVFLDGDIDNDSPKILTRELNKIKPGRVSIFINSNGGSLFAGMEIGRIIRKYGANTHIGKQNLKDRRDVAPGGCYSACALAFLGGYYRYNNEGSHYGVHRFASPSNPSPNDMDTAQIVSAAVNTYIREMGVSPALFDLMASAGSRDMYVLTTEQAAKLDVVNDGRLPPVWRIEAAKQGMYLKGGQETWVGEGYFSLLCQNKKLTFVSAYTAGEKSQSIANGGWFHSLFVDSETLPLPTPGAVTTKGDFVVTVVSVPPKYYAKLRQAKRQLGHAMQMAPDAPTFVGYHVDIKPEDGDTDRISGFIDNCTKQ